MPPRLLIACLMMLLAGVSLGQQLGRMNLHGLDYLNLGDLARGLGVDATRVGSSLVIRTGFGILTVFEGEQEFMWLGQGSDTTQELRLEAPVQSAGGQLWAPLSLIGQLGGSISGIVVVLPDRSRLLLVDGAAANPDPLELLPAGPPPVAPLDGPSLPAATPGSATVLLGNGVLALRLIGSGQSVLLVDAGLLALAQPERRQEFDAFLSELSGYRPIYFVLSAGASLMPDLEFVIGSGGNRSRHEPGDGLVVLQGDPQLVAPGQPVSGVLLLPPGTNLRQPLQVEWNDQTSSMVFRR